VKGPQASFHDVASLEARELRVADLDTGHSEGVLGLNSGGGKLLSLRVTGPIGQD
jgi:hypothetical protein